MKIVCAPKDHAFPPGGTALGVVLYGPAGSKARGSVGSVLRRQIRSERLIPSPRAWDFLSLALAVVSADEAGHRSASSDGWTRDFDLEVAVGEPGFWAGHAGSVERLLAFLTTDRWRLTFVEGRSTPEPPRVVQHPDEECVALLSGGLDSLVGAIDLHAAGSRPLAISQLVRGDAKKQITFAQAIGGGLRHLQLNHNAVVPDPEEPPSQRARSIAFLAYGVLVATTLAKYSRGETVPLYICENGFIGINPPLTGARLGSLSTRTAHPTYLGQLQSLLDAAGLRIRVENPFRFKTKGELMSECADQDVLRTYAHTSTSCGRYLRYNYRHCGRCIPCQVRRAAFRVWGEKDKTEYVFAKLGLKDDNHAYFDDVRAAAMAIAEVESDGLGRWLGTALSSAPAGEVLQLRAVVERGLSELKGLHLALGVR